MYKFLKTMNNILGVKEYNNEIFVNIQGNIYSNNLEILRGYDIEGSSFWKKKDFWYFFDNDGKRYIKKSDIKKEFEHPLIIETIHKKSILCKYNFRRENRQWKWELAEMNLDIIEITRLFDLSNFEVIFYDQSSIIGYFIENKNQLLSISAKDESIIWSIDITNLCNIGENRHIKKLGFYNEALILSISENTLVFVKKDNGQIIYKWHEVFGFKAGRFQEVIPDTRIFKFDKELGILFGTFHTYYFEIKISENKIIFLNLKDQMKKNKIVSFKLPSNICYNNIHSFFTGHASLKESPKIDFDSIIVFNKETYKIDWSYIFKNTGIGTKSPLLTETHLYQLDLNQNLHIFEKT